MADVADIEPLVIQGSDPAPLGRWFGRLGWLGFFTLVAFGWRAWRGDGVMRAPEPEIDAFLQACWVLVPICLAYSNGSARVRLRIPSDEVELPGQRASLYGPDWWSAVMMLPAPLLGIVEVGRTLTAWISGATFGPIAPRDGAVIAVVTWLVAVVAADVLFRRPRVFVGPKGIRIGYVHFVGWEDIHHVSDSPRYVGVYHSVAPSLPFTTLEAHEPEARSILDRMIRERGLRVAEGGGAALAGTKLGVIAVALAIVAGGVYATQVAGLGSTKVVATAFAAGLIATWLLERVRGISKITRQPKRVFDLKKKDAGAVAEPTGSGAPIDAEVGRSAAGTRILRHTAAAGAAATAGEIGRDEWKEKRSAHYAEWLGKCETVWHEIVPLEPHIDIDIYPPDRTRNRSFHTLITEGMSDARMKTPPGVGSDKSRIEILVYVPEFRVPAPGSQEMPFPLGVLKTLARLPFDYGTWLYVGHTVPNGDPPRPYVAGSSLTTALLLPAISEPDGFTQGFTLDGDPVTFLSVVFLTAAETQLKLDKGLDALVDLWGDDIPWMLDANRRSKV